MNIAIHTMDGPWLGWVLGLLASRHHILHVLPASLVIDPQTTIDLAIVDLTTTSPDVTPQWEKMLEALLALRQKKIRIVAVEAILNEEREFQLANQASVRYYKAKPYDEDELLAFLAEVEFLQSLKNPGPVALAA